MMLPENARRIEGFKMNLSWCGDLWSPIAPSYKIRSSQAANKQWISKKQLVYQYPTIQVIGL